MLMKGADMSGEPIGTTALGALLYKLFGSLGLTVGSFGIGAALASVVVMCMSLPRNGREWAVALISTLVSSFGGGAYAVIKFGLLAHGNDTTFLEAAQILGVAFACGLPGWTVVRLIFNWLAKQDGKTIIEAVKEIKGVA